MLSHLCTATSQLRLSRYNRAMFVAALTLAFHSCLRISEFTHSKYSQWNPRIQDVSASTSSMVYQLRQSKTDQLAQGTQVVIRRTQDHTVCPCRAMVAYLDHLEKAHPPRPLFHWDSTSTLRLCCITQTVVAALWVQPQPIQFAQLTHGCSHPCRKTRFL